MLGLPEWVAALHVPRLRVGHLVGEIRHLGAGRSARSAGERRPELMAASYMAAVRMALAHHVEIAQQAEEVAEGLEGGVNFGLGALVGGFPEQAQNPGSILVAADRFHQIGVGGGPFPRIVEFGLIDEQARMGLLRVHRPVEDHVVHAVESVAHERCAVADRPTPFALGQRRLERDRSIGGIGGREAIAFPVLPRERDHVQVPGLESAVGHGRDGRRPARRVGGGHAEFRSALSGQLHRPRAVGKDVGNAGVRAESR